MLTISVELYNFCVYTLFHVVSADYWPPAWMFKLQASKVASCIPCRRSWPNPFSSQNELNMQRGRGATKQEFTNHAMCIIDMPTYALLHSKPSPTHMETHLLWIHDKTVSILHTSPLTCRLNTPRNYIYIYIFACNIIKYNYHLFPCFHLVLFSSLLA